jgi:GNAT superfamily N-acetyltransferase
MNRRIRAWIFLLKDDAEQISSVTPRPLPLAEYGRALMKTEKLEIRAAIESDAPLVLRFIKAIAEYEKLSHEVSATEEKVRRTLCDESRCASVLLAFWDKRPAGFAVYFFNYSTFLATPGLYLEDIFVLPEFRGLGIGRELFLGLVRVAQRKGCGRLDFAVLDWNKPAQDFYQKLGAKPMKDWILFRMDRAAIAEAGAI